MLYIQIIINSIAVFKLLDDHLRLEEDHALTLSLLFDDILIDIHICFIINNLRNSIWQARNHYTSQLFNLPNNSYKIY